MDEDLNDISRITNLAKGFRKMAIPEKVGLGRGGGARGRTKTSEDDTTDIQSVGSMNTCTGDDDLHSGLASSGLRKYGGKIGLGRGYSALRRPPAAVPVPVRN